MSLFEILRERRSVCQLLVEKTQRQKQLIDDRDYDGLIAVLREKDALLNRLASLNRLLNSHSDASLPVDQQRLKSALATETENLIAGLVECHASAFELLWEQRQETQAEIAGIQDSSRLSSAYLDALAPATHRSLDVGR